jgi:hypothetical protein
MIVSRPKQAVIDPRRSSSGRPAARLYRLANHPTWTDIRRRPGPDASALRGYLNTTTACCTQNRNAWPRRGDGRRYWYAAPRSEAPPAAGPGRGCPVERAPSRTSA